MSERKQAPKKTTDNPKLSQRIRMAREFAGFSRPEVEAALQAGRGMAQKWELDDDNPDNRTPKHGTLLAMAQLYGVQARWLIQGKGDMISPSGRRAAEAISEVISARSGKGQDSSLGEDNAWLRIMARVGPRDAADAMRLERMLLRHGYTKDEALAMIGTNLQLSDRAPLVDHATPEGWIGIPIYQIQAAAGHGAINGAEEIAQSVISISPDVAWGMFGPRRRHLAAIWVQGSSMEPDLMNRDLVILDPSGGFSGEGVHVVRIEDNLLIKKVTVLGPGRFRLSSSNPAFTPIDLNAEEMTVIGPVLGHMGRI